MPKVRKIQNPVPELDTSKPIGNPGLFKPGNPGGPGRPPGSRDKITQAFLTDLQEIWQEHGMKVLQWLARKDRKALAQIMASLVPKSVEVDETRRIYRMREQPLTAEEWRAKHVREEAPKPNGGSTLQ